MAVTFVSLVMTQIMSIWVRGGHLGECREPYCRYKQRLCIIYSLFHGSYL